MEKTNICFDVSVCYRFHKKIKRLNKFERFHSYDVTKDSAIPTGALTRDPGFALDARSSIQAEVRFTP